MKVGLVGAVSLMAVACSGGPPHRTAPSTPPSGGPASSVAVAPSADPAPTVDGDLTFGTVGAVPLLVKRVPESELGTMQLYIRGGASERTANNAGRDALSVRVAVTGGTASLTKDAFDRELFRLGTEVGGTSLNAYSMFYAKALAAHMERSFELLAEVFLRPALPPREVERQRARLLTQLRARLRSPEGELNEGTRRLFYAGHPYENAASGTEETVSRFSRDDLVAHLAARRSQSRLAVVVVGPVAYATVAGWVRRHFSSLPRGAYAPPALPPVGHEAAALAFTKADLPTHYLEASFVTPGWDEPDFPASIVALRVLGQRLFDEVRTKRSLSYAPTVRHVWSAAVTRGALYVTAVDVNTTVRVMLDEVAKLKRELVTESELRGVQATFATSQLMANEATDGQADWIALVTLVGGDPRIRHQLLDRVAGVTPEQVRTFAREHLVNLQTAVVGPTAPDPAVFKLVP
ncbi:MAG: pitrilysin family protein [Myxococcota bacterium]